MSEQPTAVQIKILDKEYQINCPPSEQEALMKSARYLDENMRTIKSRGNIHGAEKNRRHGRAQYHSRHASKKPPH